ncbi:hypothetical protein QOT17_013080 [Balamuthia mandrillaris]
MNGRQPPALPLGSRSGRPIRWLYLGPVVGAPIVHIIVSMMKQYPEKRKLFYWAISSSMVATVVNRLYLMK